MSSDLQLHQYPSCINSSELKELREDHAQFRVVTKIQLAKHEDIINMLLQRINDPDDSRSVGSISSNQHSISSTPGEVVSTTGVDNEGFSDTVESCTLQDQTIHHLRNKNTSIGKTLDISNSDYFLFN